MRLKKIRISEVFFALAWFIYIFRTASPRICDQIPYFNYLIIGQFVLMAICILMKKYTKIQLLLIIFLEIILAILFKISNNYQMIMLFNFVLAFKNLELKKIVKFDIFSKTFCLLLNFFAIFINFIEFSYSIRNGKYRYDFGFYNPNTFASICMSVIIEIIYLKSINKNISKSTAILPFLTGIVLNYFCQSRGSAIILICFGIGIIFQNNRIFAKILGFLPSVFTILSWGLVNLYQSGNKVAYMIDKLVSTRLYCASNYLDIYKLNLFGNNIINYDKWIGYAQSIDICYIHQPLTNGIILYAIFILLYTILLNKISKSNNKVLIIIMFAMNIFGLVEKTALLLSCNIFLLLLSDIIFNKGELRIEDIDYNTNVQ